MIFDSRPPGKRSKTVKNGRKTVKNSEEQRAYATLPKFSI